MISVQTYQLDLFDFLIRLVGQIFELTPGLNKAHTN